MPGFPNFFMLVGPNSPIGNISLIDISERQADYILKCTDLLRRGRARSLAPRVDATNAFHERIYGNDFAYILHPESGQAYVIVSYGADGEDGGEGLNADLYSTDPF